MSADLGLVGLGVMGANLALNFSDQGFTVAVHDHSPEAISRFIDAHPERSFVACPTLESLAAACTKSRRILMMITAGKPVDMVLEGIAPFLEAGDMLIDGGNSHYGDTDRRLDFAAERGFRFVGMGVSGGAKGARFGPSIMPGGDPAAWPLLKPILEPIAAVSDSGPCVTWCGERSAGHFVKMVHNGIEYGDMQLIAEAYVLLKEGLGHSNGEIAARFAAWNEGPLQSYLIEITSKVAGYADTDGAPLVEKILDVAGQKGTGRWTAINALDLGVPCPTITAAVEARGLSAMHAERLEAAERFGDCQSPTILDLDPVDLESALYAAKLMSYTQGFALLQAASAQRGYAIDRGAVARIWKAGCIIRAAFLDRVTQAFTQSPELELLALSPGFADELRQHLPGWRRVVGAAIASGIPVPALSGSLAYFDGLTRARGSARVIQAQRDFFGAHTYRRLDAPEIAVHTEWESGQ